MSVEVNWPKGYGVLYKKIALNADKILSGQLLAIDPASGGTSLPGFAIFEAGILVMSGTVKFPAKKADIYHRLQYLHAEVGKLLPAPPDVLAIEEVHKNLGHQHLLWSIGVSVAAAQAPTNFEIPINVWKALAKVSPEYTKSDAADAVMIGRSLILLAQRGR